MLNDSEGSSLSGIAGVLGQFGLGGGSGESNLDKIIELSRSRSIMEKTIFSEGQVDGSTGLMANHLIATMEAEKQWKGKGLLPFGKDDGLNLEGFRFKHTKSDSFSLLEKKALKRVHRYLMGKELLGAAFQSYYSELSGIMNFDLYTSNPELSVKLVKSHFQNLSDFYLEKNSEKQAKDFKIIKTKYDSIEQLKLGTMLGEAEKQYQLAQFALENKSAFIQVIDEPMLPLRPVNKGKLYYFLLGGLLGGIFSVAYTILKKAYQDLMSA